MNGTNISALRVLSAAKEAPRLEKGDFEPERHVSALINSLKYHHTIVSFICLGSMKMSLAVGRSGTEPRVSQRDETAPALAWQRCDHPPDALQRRPPALQPDSFESTCSV